MSIANRMDLNSLIFILQGHAKSLNLPAAAQQKAAQKISGQKKTAAKKKFRFALNQQQNVRCAVHVVPSVKDHEELWFSDAEMKHIRANAIHDVKYYRKYRPDFTQCVEVLANSANIISNNTNSSERNHTATVEKTMKKLMADSYARGLEVHIVGLLADIRRETVRAVIDEQKECRMCGDSPDITAESLREQSLAYSSQSKTFALKMAQCDQIEALKASLSSRWEAEGPEASSLSCKVKRNTSSSSSNQNTPKKSASRSSSNSRSSTNSSAGASPKIKKATTTSKSSTFRRVVEC